MMVGWKALSQSSIILSRGKYVAALTNEFLLLSVSKWKVETSKLAVKNGFCAMIRYKFSITFVHFKESTSIETD